MLLYFTQKLIRFYAIKVLAMERTGDSRNPSQPSEYRQLAAIMFTDIVSYSKLMSQNEQLALDVMRTNRLIQKSLVEQYYGKWIKEIGDGVLAMFRTAYDSLQCAMAIQKAIREQCDHQVRIGIHLGDITLEGDDAFGDGVNIAARIQSIADPGGIYVSESVFRAVRARSDHPVHDLGEIYLKNIVHPIRIYALVGDGLPSPSDQIQKPEVQKKKSLWPKVVDVPNEEKLIDHHRKISDLSIAVLPFKNLSPDQENQYFADGVMGDILNKLQQMHELKVISQTSVEQYRNTTKAISQIGSELGVSYLLEGSVRKGYDEIMITAQLINARDDRHVWADNFTSTYSTKGIFKIQREIAEKIVSKLHLKISPEKISRITQPKTKNNNAYDHYLRGMFHWYQMTAQGLETALHYFELARDEDPNYALAYAGIAMVWGGYIQHGLVSSEEASPKVKEAAAKALALDSSLAEVHYMLGMAMLTGWWEWNWEVAEREFRKTIELNPNFAEVRIYYAHQLDIQGRLEEAEIQAKKAMEIEPFNSFIQVVYAMHLNLVRRYDESVKVLNNLLAMDPNNYFALSTLRSSYHNLQMYDEALEAWKKSFETKGDQEAVEALKRGNEEGGYRMALQQIAELLVARSDTSFITPWQIATLYTRAGKNHEALDWLEKSYQDRDANMTYISVDPIFDELRDDPRFGKLLREMKFPEKFENRNGMNNLVSS